MESATTSKRGVGVYTLFGIHGECEIATTFEVLTAQKPNNHLLTHGKMTCINGITRNGIAMTVSSRLDSVVGLPLGGGSVRFVNYTVDPAVWKALGTIAGRETLSGDAD
jgi:hypothetical protein